MGMPLHSRIPKDEINDPERFDFLQSYRNKVARVDEVHANTDDDSRFIFLIWLKPEFNGETEKLRRETKKNFDASDLDRDWAFKVIPDTGDGLIVVNTWIG